YPRPRIDAGPPHPPDIAPYGRERPGRRGPLEPFPGRFRGRHPLPLGRRGSCLFLPTSSSTRGPSAAHSCRWRVRGSWLSVRGLRKTLPTSSPKHGKGTIEVVESNFGSARHPSTTDEIGQKPPPRGACVPFSVSRTARPVPTSAPRKWPTPG